MEEIIIISPEPSTLLIFGIFMFLMIMAGYTFTIFEFRKMKKHPEDYQDK